MQIIELTKDNYKHYLDFAVNFTLPAFGKLMPRGTDAYNFIDIFEVANKELGYRLVMNFEQGEASIYLDDLREIADLNKTEWVDEVDGVCVTSDFATLSEIATICLAVFLEQQFN